MITVATLLALTVSTGMMHDYKPGRYPLNLGKCTVGHSQDISKFAITTVDITVGDYRIPAGSQIFVIGQVCNSGQVYPDGSQADNFYRYLIRHNGRVMEISGGSFNYQ